MTNFLENCLFCADLLQKHRFEIRPIGQICLKTTYVSEAQKVKIGEFLKILKNPKMSKFSTFFENVSSASYMLPLIELK